MGRRRKPRKPAGPPTCRICTALIWWGRGRPGEGDTNKPLDPTQAVYVDIDGEDSTGRAYYDEYRQLTRGTVIRDLAANEQRAADQGQTPGLGAGVRRVVKCYPLHACDPQGHRREPPSVQKQEPAPAAAMGGQDRAAGGDEG